MNAVRSPSVSCLLETSNGGLRAEDGQRAEGGGAGASRYAKSKKHGSLQIGRLFFQGGALKYRHLSPVRLSTLFPFNRFAAVETNKRQQASPMHRGFIRTISDRSKCSTILNVSPPAAQSRRPFSGHIEPTAALGPCICLICIETRSKAHRQQEAENPRGNGRHLARHNWPSGRGIRRATMTTT